jgi:hypothetical protein
MPKVSGRMPDYSRFRETAIGDWLRSPLHGGRGSAIRNADSALFDWESAASGRSQEIAKINQSAVFLRFPHWLMVVGACLVLFGFIGLAFPQMLRRLKRIWSKPIRQACPAGARSGAEGEGK